MGTFALGSVINVRVYQIMMWGRRRVVFGGPDILCRRCFLPRRTGYSVE
jgi:hypothetical protein